MKKFYFVVFLIILSFLVGSQYGSAHPGFQPLGDLTIGKAGSSGIFSFLDNKSKAQAPKDVNWQILWDVIDKINEKYVHGPADLTKVLYGAASGAVASLEDPYSVFFPPKQAEEFQKELAGNFEGIGAEIAIKNQQLVVVAPIDGSPAQKAGLKPGDAILKIDEQDSNGLGLQEAVDKIRGVSGTKVKLTIGRKGESKPRDLEIVRAQIIVRSLDFEIKEIKGKKIGYLKLRRFGEDSATGTQKAIDELLKSGVQAMIMDVRSNPGGYLDTAVQIAGNWLEKDKPVVIQKFGDGTEEVFKSKGPGKLADLPTVVLLNAGSASASEILAGALRDHGIAKLVGEKSFGKGSVQEVIQLQDKAELKITVAEWLTPNKININKAGIEPDVKVELTDEDFQGDLDPQLDKALELLVQ